MTKALNAAIIGCGTIYKNHAEAVTALDNVRLYAVCDIDAQKAQQASAQYGCSFYTDYHELLRDENIDVVHICTPHYLHATMAIEAMKNGIHVLTEKPIATSVEDALSMVTAAQETGMSLGVCFQNRYNATSQRIKEILHPDISGAILGAKALVTWHRDEKYYSESSWRGSLEKEGGGVLINQSIHTIDLIQWFMGRMTAVKAHVDTRLLQGIIEVEDTADATFLFENGSSCVFYATNNYAANSPIEIEIVCERAVITLRDKLIISYADGKTEVVEENDKATGSKAYWGCSHEALIRDFYDALQLNRPFAVDGLEGIKAIEIIKAIYKSSESRSMQWLI